MAGALASARGPQRPIGLGALAQGGVAPQQLADALAALAAQQPAGTPAPTPGPAPSPCSQRTAGAERGVQQQQHRTPLSVAQKGAGAMGGSVLDFFSKKARTGEHGEAGAAGAELQAGAVGGDAEMEEAGAAAGPAGDGERGGLGSRESVGQEQGEGLAAPQSPAEGAAGVTGGAGRVKEQEHEAVADAGMEVDGAKEEAGTPRRGQAEAAAKQEQEDTEGPLPRPM